MRSQKFLHEGKLQCLVQYICLEPNIEADCTFFPLEIEETAEQLGRLFMNSRENIDL